MIKAAIVLGVFLLAIIVTQLLPYHICEDGYEVAPGWPLIVALILSPMVFFWPIKRKAMQTGLSIEQPEDSTDE